MISVLFMETHGRSIGRGSRNSSVQFSVRRGEVEGGVHKERYDERK